MNCNYRYVAWIVGLALYVSIVSPVGAQLDVNETIQETGAIFTYLLDTGVPSASPLSTEAIEKKAGWAILGEDVNDHEFAGDAVLLNDRLAVVMRRRGVGAEVYTRTQDGLHQRAAVAPRLLTDVEKYGPNHMRIVENQPGAVEVEVAFNVEGSVVAATAYRLTTGQPYMRVQPSREIDALRVQVTTPFLVVPDFFADDLVYDARAFTQARIGLPVENFYLHLAAGDGDRQTGSSIVTCIWKSTLKGAAVAQEAAAILGGEGNNRIIQASEIACRGGKTIWVAFAEHDQIWRSFPIAENEAQVDLYLEWSPPFSAKWRGDFLGTDEIAESWDFREGRLADYEAVGFDRQVYPCWFQGDQPYVRPPRVQSARAGGVTPRLLVIYPIDRTQSTPLNEFCLIDIMRNTLGVGACQYVLDLEGLDSESTPTPALVTEWVEKQFRRERETRYAEQIRDRLDLMIGHLAHVEDRIAEYGALEHTILELDTRSDTEGNRETIAEIQAILDDMAYTIARFESARKTPAFAEELVEQIIGLVGQEGAYAECEQLGHELRMMGAAQDRTLSKCRMALRRLRQYCLTRQLTTSDEPDVKNLLSQILNQVEQFLRDKG